MPKYRVTEKSFVNNRVCEEGEIVDYDPGKGGQVHSNLEIHEDEETKAAKAKAKAAKKAEAEAKAKAEAEAKAKAEAEAKAKAEAEAKAKTLA